jgi:alpha-tubulin N-acetyltransferase 1
MQYHAGNIDASKVFGTGANPISVWDSSTLRKFRNHPQAQLLYRAIDELGRGSKTAQGLNNVLTSVERLHDNQQHRLYLLQKDKCFIGIIKVGVKKLFIRTKSGDLKEIDPLCVLDFYVAESEQRSGFGRVLYDAMLEREGVRPHQLAYDRPSPKFVGFLRKHFGLSDFVPQTNNFVVYEQYFSGASTSQPRAPPTNERRTAAPMMPADRRAADAEPIPHPTGPPQPMPLMQQRGMAAEAIPRNSVPTPFGGSFSATSGRVPSQSMSSALAATLPKQQPAAVGASMRAGRMVSPTRSGAGYNIITLADSPSPASMARTVH